MDTFTMELSGGSRRIDSKEATLSRREIDAKLAASGDYVKMDYLQACLKKPLDFDTKRFVMTKLASIYESRMMYLEAGKLVRNVADINTTYEGKVNDFVKSMSLFIKAVNFAEADISFKKAIAIATPKQKPEIKMKFKEMFKMQAKEFMARDKRKHALETYEMLATLDLNPIEKKEVESALIRLYEKLGKVKEYYNLKNGAMKVGSTPQRTHARSADDEVIERPSDFDVNSLFE